MKRAETETMTLIEMVLAGRTDRFADIIDAYQGKVHALVSGIVADVSTADEVTQDVFVKVFQQLAKFKGKSSFGSWIYRIAYNTAIDSVRRERNNAVRLDEVRLSQLSDAEVESVLDTDSDNEERIALLEKALSMIGAEERALITMMYYDGLSVKEISEISGLSEANVKVRLMRTRRKLYLLYNELTTGLI